MCWEGEGEGERVSGVGVGGEDGCFGGERYDASGFVLGEYAFIGLVEMG